MANNDVVTLQLTVNGAFHAIDGKPIYVLTGKEAYTNHEIIVYSDKNFYSGQWVTGHHTSNLPYNKKERVPYLINTTPTTKEAVEALRKYNKRGPIRRFLDSRVFSPFKLKLGRPFKAIGASLLVLAGGSVAAVAAVKIFTPARYDTNFRLDTMTAAQALKQGISPDKVSQKIVDNTLIEADPKHQLDKDQVAKYKLDLTSASQPYVRFLQQHVDKYAGNPSKEDLNQAWTEAWSLRTQKDNVTGALITGGYQNSPARVTHRIKLHP